MNGTARISAAERHVIEREWRVQMDESTWRDALTEARAICSPSEEGRVTDVVFGRSGFDSVREHGWVLRIREADEYVLELKERIDDGVWQETKVKIEPPGNLRYILERIGLTPHLLIDRRRVSFQDRGTVVCFDQIELLGFFVEVEELGRETASILAPIVGQVRALPLEPPYGDIVKERLEGDPAFSQAYAAMQASFRFAKRGSAR